MAFTPTRRRKPESTHRHTYSQTSLHICLIQNKISSHHQGNCQYIKPYNHYKVNLYFIFFTGILICPSLCSVFLDTSSSPHSLTINIISHKIYNLVPKLILYNMSCFFNYPETFFNYIGCIIFCKF